MQHSSVFLHVLDAWDHSVHAAEEIKKATEMSQSESDKSASDAQEEADAYPSSEPGGISIKLGIESISDLDTRALSGSQASPTPSGPRGSTNEGSAGEKVKAPSIPSVLKSLDESIDLLKSLDSDDARMDQLQSVLFEADQWLASFGVASSESSDMTTAQMDTPFSEAPIPDPMSSAFHNPPTSFETLPSPTETVFNLELPFNFAAGETNASSSEGFNHSDQAPAAAAVSTSSPPSEVPSSSTPDGRPSLLLHQMSSDTSGSIRLWSEGINEDGKSCLIARPTEEQISNKNWAVLPLMVRPPMKTAASREGRTIAFCRPAALLPLPASQDPGCCSAGVEPAANSLLDLTRASTSQLGDEGPVISA